MQGPEILTQKYDRSKLMIQVIQQLCIQSFSLSLIARLSKHSSLCNILGTEDLTQWVYYTCQNGQIIFEKKQ